MDSHIDSTSKPAINVNAFSKMTQLLQSLQINYVSLKTITIKLIKRACYLVYPLIPAEADRLLCSWIHR